MLSVWSGRSVGSGARAEQGGQPGAARAGARLVLSDPAGHGRAGAGGEGCDPHLPNKRMHLGQHASEGLCPSGGRHSPTSWVQRDVHRCWNVP